MMKLKYMISRTVGVLGGMAFMAPSALNMVGAANDYVNLSNSTLNPDGTLKIDGAGASSTGNTVNVFNTIMSKGRIVIAGVTGVLAVVMVGLFTWKAFNLAKSSDSPQERAKCINSMIFYFIGAACFGAASMFAGLFYNMLN